MKNQIKPKNSLFRISWKYGIITGLISIAYFILMKLLGLAHIYQLRYLNILILIGGTYIALKSMEDKNKLRYLNSLGVSMMIACVSYTMLAAFLFIYLKFDTELMEYYVNHAPMGQYLTPFYVAFWVANEGIGMQPILALILIEFMKGFTKRHQGSHKGYSSSPSER